MTVSINGVAQVSHIIWKDASQTALNDTNRVDNLAFTELDLTSFTSPRAKFAIVRMEMEADVIGGGNDSEIRIKKNGTTPAHYPRFVLDVGGTTAGVDKYTVAIVGLDVNRKIAYAIDVGAGWTVDSAIRVLGYVE